MTNNFKLFTSNFSPAETRPNLFSVD